MQIQDEAMYCGTGCQPGFGNCLLGMAKPPLPVSAPGIAQGGETCGPIVNKKCATGLCCSGSNFCGMLFFFFFLPGPHILYLVDVCAL